MDMKNVVVASALVVISAGIMANNGFARRTVIKLPIAAQKVEEILRSESPEELEIVINDIRITSSDIEPFTEILPMVPFVRSIVLRCYYVPREGQVVKKLLDISTREKWSVNLDLVGIYWDNEGFRLLLEALERNTVLIPYLSLSYCNLGVGGARALVKALGSNATLTKLNLSCNKRFIENAWLRLLSEALKTNTTLSELGLERNKIGDEGAGAISEILKTNTTLTELDLGHNKIGDEGAGAISKTLETNATLTTLNLSWNKIGDEGAGAISKTLKANITLTTLNLSFNSIGNAGVEVISEALKTNATLTELGLFGDEIDTWGARTILEALGKNTTLTEIALEDELLNYDFPENKKRPRPDESSESAQK